MKIYNLIIGLLVVVFCNGQVDSVSVDDSTETLYTLGDHQNLEQLGDSGLSEITVNSNAGQTIWNPFENFVDSNQFELLTGGPGSISRSLFFNFDENINLVNHLGLKTSRFSKYTEAMENLNYIK